ncbi:plasmid fertility inhibition factor family protein [Shewanella frigidimarina]|uniref:plasmid fertility inhibition factor family protein n=1 Tax=Shewanella frigidimarina TaxID=56812 RepID=UPI003D7B0FCB
MLIEQINPDLFKIPLPIGAVYPHLIWKTDLPSNRFSDDWEVIFAPMKRFIDLCIDPSIKMIDPAEGWNTDKREEYIKGQSPEDYSMSMPRIGFSQRDLRVSTFMGLLGKTKSVWSVGFVNGRHRTRIAEYLGAEFIPVQVNKSEANALKKHLGI